MNILEEIQNCPVEWKELGEVVDTVTSPVKLTKKEYQVTGRIPIVDQGEQFVAGYADNEKYLEKDEYIIFGDHSEHIKYVDFAFVQGADGLKILKPKSGIKAKYIYYCLCNFYKKEGSYKRHWSKARTTFIPIPRSEDIQKKIVQKLDKMTEYVTELTSELTSRKKQYSFYRDKLLSFEDEVYQVEWKTLGKLLKKGKGTKITASQMKALHKDGAPIRIFAGGKTYADVNYGDIPDKDIHTEVAIIVKSRGIIDFEYCTKPFSFKNEFWSYSSDNENINLRYVYYYLVHNKGHFQNIANNMQMPQISSNDTEKFKIPVPSLEIQSRIVQVLDNFDKVCNDLNIGLPKEIELRQKQYEYFREKLLTFTAEGVYPDSGQWTVAWAQSDLIKLLNWVFGPIRVELGSIFDIVAGGDVPKDAMSETKTADFCYPILSNGIEEKSIYGWTNKPKIQQPSLTVSARGTIGWTSYREESFYPIVRLLVLTPKIKFNLKYAYYFMKSIENDYEIPKSGIPQLTKPMIKGKVMILPSLADQDKIVSILDNFNTLTTSISQGLPKEIELRQKQYEYWRNCLLDFQ